MTRTGKIARLSRSTRDELNRRLQDGEPGVRLVQWLNGLAETSTILLTAFAGRPISQQNLSEWKSGGYRDWLAQQELLCQARALAADARELAEATDHRLTDHLAATLAGRYAATLGQWNGEITDELRLKLRALHSLSQDVVRLRRADLSAARLDLQRQRLDRENNKPEQELLQHCERQAGEPEVRICDCGRSLSPEERHRRIRQILGLPPEPYGPSHANSAATDEPVSNQIKPNQTI